MRFCGGGVTAGLELLVLLVEEEVSGRGVGGSSLVAFRSALRGVMNPSLLVLMLLLLVLLPVPSLLVTSDRMGKGDTMLLLLLLLMLVTTAGILGVVLRLLLPRMERALLVPVVRVAVSSSSILQILLRKHPPLPPPGVALPPLRRRELLWDSVVATVVGVAIDVDTIALLAVLAVVVVLSFSSCLMGVNHCSWRVVAVVVENADAVPLLAELLVLVLLARGEYNGDCVDSLRVATLVVVLDVPTLALAVALLLVVASPRRDRGETTAMVLWPRPFRPVFIPALLVRPGGG